MIEAKSAFLTWSQPVSCAVCGNNGNSDRNWLVVADRIDHWGTIRLSAVVSVDWA